MTAAVPPRFLALGDSYTNGEGVGAAERWPVQLVSALRAERVDIAETVIIARTGWTTDELSAAIERETPMPPFALVSLLIGVNDQYRGRAVASYRAPFAALLDQAIAFAAGRADRVVVASIPDWGVTPFAASRDRAAIAREIDAYNAVSREIAAAKRANYVDVTPASRRAAADPALTTTDGLHPSAAMYSEWVKLILPIARRILTAR